MKTVGERIRQARDARGLSGEQLAHAVGYSKQSAISNLENRATGTGGTKIAQIATALRVPVQWLLTGPDGPDVPYSSPASELPSAETMFDLASNRSASESSPNAYSPDGSLTEAMALFPSLTTAERIKVISYMNFLASEGARETQESHGDRYSVPQPKAA
jgi:transcriptional regulator with XRE-family HTH domain